MTPCGQKNGQRGGITVVWNSDDLKLSHKHGNEVKKLINYLEEIYGKIII